MKLSIKLLKYFSLRFRKNPKISHWRFQIPIDYKGFVGVLNNSSLIHDETYSSPRCFLTGWLIQPISRTWLRSNSWGNLTIFASVKCAYACMISTIAYPHCYWLPVSAVVPASPNCYPRMQVTDNWALPSHEILFFSQQNVLINYAWNFHLT